MNLGQLKRQDLKTLDLAWNEPVEPGWQTDVRRCLIWYKLNLLNWRWFEDVWFCGKTGRRSRNAETAEAGINLSSVSLNISFRRREQLVSGVRAVSKLNIDSDGQHSNITSGIITLDHGTCSHYDARQGQAHQCPQQFARLLKCLIKSYAPSSNLVSKHLVIFSSPCRKYRRHL